MNWRRFLNRKVGLSLIALVSIVILLLGAYEFGRQTQKTSLEETHRREIFYLEQEATRITYFQQQGSTQNAIYNHYIASFDGAITANCVINLAHETANALLSTAEMATLTPFPFTPPPTITSAPRPTSNLQVPDVSAARMTATKIIANATATQCVTEVSNGIQVHPASCAMVNAPVIIPSCLSPSVR